MMGGWPDNPNIDPADRPRAGDCGVLTNPDADGTLYTLSCGRFMCDREQCVTLGACAALRAVRDGERCPDCPHLLAEHDDTGCDASVIEDGCSCRSTRISTAPCWYPVECKHGYDCCPMCDAPAP